MCRRIPLALALIALLAPSLAAQDENDPAERLRALESWIVLEEETAPEPPLLRLEAGLMGFIESRSQLRADRAGVRGTDLTDLETQQGLQSGGLGPWLELSIGGKVRGGADLLRFVRGGSGFDQQDDPVDFDGRRVADAGDYLESSFKFLSVGAFVEWDVLYGRTYRIGLVGGLRYFRLDFDLRSLKVQRPPYQTFHTRVRGELLSPFFGGLIELTPFSYLSVYTQVQFMNWSWDAVELSEARYFHFRLGARLNVIPEFFSIGLEYRFLILSAKPSQTNSRRLEGDLSANGLGVYVTVAF